MASVFAFGLTLWIDNPAIEPNTLLILLFAVTFSSWMGGWGPGLLATALTALAAKWFMLPALHSLALQNYEAALRFAEYLTISLFIVALNAARRKAQAKTEDARGQAEAAWRARDEFIALITHELRTPLNAILGWAKVLGDGRLEPERQAAALDVIGRNARALSKLIDDLLDASRIIKGKLRLGIEPLNLLTVVTAAAESVRPAAAAKLIELTVVSDEAGVEAAGDAGRLQQVVLNLLTNAIKFTPERGVVEVRLEKAESSARISVSDTGRGIAPEFLPYIFERFSQDERAQKPAQGGLGLGLAISRRLVELHDGTIEARSRGEGMGATFVITLPLPAKAVALSKDTMWRQMRSGEFQ
ncbi:MAG: Sensor histidine kinase RcsC [Acidobacteria bacterium]|nr:Sensor histidine kinase RcsC [Acidobacteriota bacterium]